MIHEVYIPDNDKDAPCNASGNLSDCCAAEMYDDSDICSDCGEHCGIEEKDWDEVYDTKREESL